MLNTCPDEMTSTQLHRRTESNIHIIVHGFLQLTLSIDHLYKWSKFAIQTILLYWGTAPKYLGIAQWKKSDGDANDDSVRETIRCCVVLKNQSSNMDTLEALDCDWNFSLISTTVYNIHAYYKLLAINRQFPENTEASTLRLLKFWTGWNKV